MSRISEYERGVLASSMSPGSAAMILGRSAKWVEVQRQALAKPPAPEPVIVTAPEPVIVTVPPPQVPPVVCALPPGPVVICAAPQPSIPPRVIRWAKWFVDARWRLPEVAHLFDVDPFTLRRALEARP